MKRGVPFFIRESCFYKEAEVNETMRLKVKEVF